jgi:uncharacterized protein (DUF433 family)
MAFPLDLTSVLTGATPSQLRLWNRKGLVVPEARRERPPLYSFRDLVALRALVFLRKETSLQRITKAFMTLPILELTEHPSRYRFGTDGKTIVAGLDDGSVVDLLRNPGQIDFFSFEDALRSFTNFKGADVPNFNRPGDHLEVEPGRMHGWPTIEDTRVPYNTVANLVDFRTVMPEEVAEFYPGVSADAALGAVEFDRRVKEVLPAS